MKSVQARPQSLSEFFAEKIYIIPSYQRRYSWENDQCEQLWDDILDFHSQNNRDSNEKYFLGSVVLESKSNKEGAFYIIDGQQRITSLILLMSALFSRAADHTVLEKTFKKTHETTGTPLPELRLKSKVIEEDENSLSNVALGINSENCEHSLYFKNKQFFISRIDQWVRGKNSDDTKSLIKDLLNKIVLLPIECESDDDALVLFNTLNDRGLQLADSDIIKAKIYTTIDHINDKNDFIDRWNQVIEELEKYQDSKDMTDLFRIHMHVDRARKEIVSKEVALRKYFDEHKLYEYPETMHALEFYSSFDGWQGTPTINVIWSILSHHNNVYWKYPLYVYIANRCNGCTIDKISKDDLAGFEMLCSELLKYFIIKGVVRNSVNSVKDFVFRLCASIAIGVSIKKITDAIRKGYMEDEKEFMQLINEPLERRYSKTLVMIAAYLDSLESGASLNDLSDVVLNSKFDVEHILPKKWNNYDGWIYDQHKQSLNLLGNLVLLEKPLNIAASNEFFIRKKDAYKKSKISAAVNLSKHKSKNWSKPELMARHHEAVGMLKKYISNTKFVN